MTLATRVKEIAELGLDKMISDVQAELGVVTDDIATQHFSGNEARDRITVILMDYVISELRVQIDILELKDHTK